MNDLEKAVRIYDIPENRKYSFNSEKMTMSVVETVVAQQVEKIEDLVCENIIKCLPEDVTKVLFLDKAKVVEIFKKQIPKKPKEGSRAIKAGIDAANCGSCGRLIFSSESYCKRCGQKLDWSEVQE